MFGRLITSTESFRLSRAVFNDLAFFPSCSFARSRPTAQLSFFSTLLARSLDRRCPRQVGFGTQRFVLHLSSLLVIETATQRRRAFVRPGNESPLTFADLACLGFLFTEWNFDGSSVSSSFPCSKRSSSRSKTGGLPSLPSLQPH